MEDILVGFFVVCLILVVTCMIVLVTWYGLTTPYFKYKLYKKYTSIKLPPVLFPAAVFFMTRHAKGIFRLLADEGRSGGRGRQGRLYPVVTKHYILTSKMSCLVGRHEFVPAL